MPASGESWNQFRLLQPLSKGGMGEVFLAEDDSLHRKVALKFLPELLQQDAAARQRFLQEARSAAALDHPYICKIYEIDEVGGRAFIAMEYVDGVTLHEKVARSPLRLPELLQLATEITEAVEAAHKKNIVHRDLKTPNIMVTPDGHAKVMDFGLAKQVLVETGNDSKVSTLSGRLTEGGKTPGTVFYMSPEQVRGEPVDPRSDIFSLGVVLYEMATGKVPFQGATSGLTYDAILNRGAVPPRSLNPDIPNELEQIIEKALEKDRENRYQSAKELLVDLRRLKRDTDSGVTPLSEPGFARPRPRRRARGLWATAAVLALVVVVLGVLLFRTSSEIARGPIDSLAVLPFENTRSDPNVDYLSDGIAESLINRLSQLPQLRVMARSAAFRYRGRDLDPRAVGRELDVGAVLTGRVVQQGDTLNVHAELVDVRTGGQLWGEQYSEELADIVSVQNNLATEITQALRLQLNVEEREELGRHDTMSSAAYQAYLKGRYLWNKRANEEVRKAIGFFQQAIEEDPGYALAHAGLADAYLILGGQFYGADPEFSPQETLAKAKASAREAIRLDPTLAEPRASLAFIEFFHDWSWEEAERDFQLALEHDSGYATLQHWYAFYLSTMDRHEEAIARARRGIELEPSSPLNNRNLALILYRARRYTEAVAQMERTRELDASFPTVTEYLALFSWQSGMRERAVEEAQTLGQPLASFFQLLHEDKSEEASDAIAAAGSELSFTIRVTCYGLAGDRERLLTELEAAARERLPGLVFVMGDPAVAGVSSDPRYLEIRRQMGLEP